MSAGAVTRGEAQRRRQSCEQGFIHRGAASRERGDEAAHAPPPVVTAPALRPADRTVASLRSRRVHDVDEAALDQLAGER
ncbi:MAG: hypothetical protein ACHQQ3_13845, partial [Gemmatimonadales bacterium]